MILGAACATTKRLQAPPGSGALNGLTFVIKDNLHVAGHRTGCGNPDWLRTHPKATATASRVARTLAAGASLVGKTQCDALIGLLVRHRLRLRVNVARLIPASPTAAASVPA